MPAAGQTASAPRHRCPSLEHLWALAVLACIWAFVSTHPIRPHDFWWHLAVGRQIAQTGAVPTHDTFSYTAAGGAYAAYQVYWLAELLLYRVYEAGGPALSVFTHSVVITLTYGLLLALCWSLSGSGRLAALCTLAAAAPGFENWNLRPQAVAFLLAAVYLWQIYAWRRNPRRSPWNVAWFPVLMVVWVNSHGSFPLGLVLLGMWLLEALVETAGLPRLRAGERGAGCGPDGSPACGRSGGAAACGAAAAAALLSALAAACGNPGGMPLLLRYLVTMAQHPVVRQLPEWAPASLATKDGLAFFAVLALSLVLLCLCWRRLRLFHVLSFLLFAAVAWKTGRAIIWFGLVVAPILAEVLPGAWRAPGPLAEGSTAGRPTVPPGGAGDRPPDRAECVVNTILALGLVALVVVTLPWLKYRLPLPEQKAGLISAETPLAATAYLLREHPPAPLFADMGYGSYLVWAAQPHYRVFADPRVELYPARVWDDYHALSRGDAGWEARLDRYGVRTLMLDLRLQAGLAAQAARSAQWREVYRDRRTAILVRSPSAPTPLRSTLTPSPSPRGRGE